MADDPPLLAPDDRSSPAPQALARRHRILRALIALPLVGLLGTTIIGIGVVRIVGPPPTASIPRLVPGTITVGERAQGTYEVGPHTVVLSSDGMTISHPRSPQAVWTSPSGRAFLIAGDGDATVRDDRGVLRIDDQVEDVHARQVVDGADVDSDGRLVVTGSLHDEEGGSSVSYQLFLETSAFRGAQLQMTAKVLDEQMDRLSLVSALGPGERVHGLGEQFTGFDLRGRLYPLVPREQGVVRGRQPMSLLVDLFSRNAGSADTTYAPLPVVITSAPRSLWLADPGMAVVDLRTPTRMSTIVWGSELHARMGVGDTPAAHVTSHARATGLMRRPPGWVSQGLVAGLSGGSAQVTADLQALADADVAVTAVLIHDWAGQQDGNGAGRAWGAWTVDPSTYPDWSTLVEDLTADGMRVLTYASPWLSADAGAASAAASGRDLFSEAANLGHLLLGPDGEPAMQDLEGTAAAAVNLFEDSAREWFVDVLVEEVLGSGASGFMADVAEGPPVASAEESSAGLIGRGSYATLWAAVTRQALVEAGLEEDGLVMLRSAASETAGLATMFWTGDQLQDFSRGDGLGSAFDGLLQGGMSGMALNHHEIGGHTALVLPGPLPDVVRSAELLQRSAELAVFTSMMRTSPGSNPERAREVADEVVQAHLSAMTSLFLALAPERQRLNFDLSERGLPMLRHPILVVPEQPDVANQPDVAFLGDDLFFAPVLRDGVRTRNVTLPAGSWVDIWTGERHDVARNAVAEMSVDAPLGQPPAWARAGTQVDEDLSRWRVQRGL